MARSATILGLAKLDRMMKRMPDVAKQLIQDAMAQGADEIIDMMKRLVPVDNGDLRDSITATHAAPTKSFIPTSKARSRGLFLYQDIVEHGN